jgi:hypothetical protein
MKDKVAEASKNSPFETQQWTDYLRDLGEAQGFSAPEMEEYLVSVCDEEYEVIMANFLINFKYTDNG